MFAVGKGLQRRTDQKDHRFPLHDLVVATFQGRFIPDLYDLYDLYDLHDLKLMLPDGSRRTCMI